MQNVTKWVPNWINGRRGGRLNSSRSEPMFSESAEAKVAHSLTRFRSLIQSIRMPTRDSTLSGILRSPARILAIILILVFCTEVVVMLVLPYVIPRFLGVTGEAFVDAVLLTLVCAPVLWFVILAAKRAEEQRIDMARETEALRAQQMTTLAQLATGVAHEIRNPLTSIKMLIQVNRAKFAEEGLPTEDLELVEQEIRRMERSVNSLLDYARPEPSTFEPVVIQSVIRKTVHLIDGRCSAEAVELNVDVPKSPITIIGDSAQLKQLLLNLVLNAFDAMPGGGKLCLNLTEQDDAIALSVQDTGSGICEEVESRLFSPFVTTKANGVGLGLGICRRIAELHNGTLTGFNRATGGAEFLLTLPKTQGQEHPSQDGTASIPMARSDIEGSCKVC